MATTPQRPPPPIPRRHPSRGSVTSLPSSPSSQNGSPYSPLLHKKQSSSTLDSSGWSSGPSSEQRHSYNDDATVIESSSSSSTLSATAIAPDVTEGSDSGATRLESPDAQPAMNRLSQGAGIGLGAVGLGPVRIDFKDWVKAGREAREGSVEEENQHASERYSLGSHRESGGNRESEPAWGANDTDGARRDSGPVYDRPLSRLRQSQSSLPTSHSISSSLSIDSSHSPQNRTSSRASERIINTDTMRSSNSTPRRTSHDLVREMNNLSLNGDSRRISLPQSPGPSPASPSRQRPSPVAAMTSPLERRFSRRMISRHDSVSAIDRLDEEGEMETMVSLESTPSKTLEDRIRESEERLARRSSLRSPDPTPQRLQRFSSVHSGRDGFEVSSRNGATTPNADERSPSKTPSSGGRMGKARPPLPLEFQDTRLFTPSPKSEQTAHVDLQSPVPMARERSRELAKESSHYDLASPRSQRSHNTARPQSVLERRDVLGSRTSDVGRSGSGRSPLLPRSESRNDFDRFRQPINRRREFPTRNRPESVLETTADHDRYNSQYSPSRLGQHSDDRARRLGVIIGERGYAAARASGDFAARLRELPSPDPSRLSHAVGPSDSISAVGSRTETPGRKDPMDVLRRLEETRDKSNKRWEEDRSASVLGDRSPSVMGRYGEREMLARPSSRMDESYGRPSSRMSTATSASRMRPASSLASVRVERLSQTPRTMPMVRRRTDSTEDAAAESPLLGRTSRGSYNSSIEPRVTRRSQTSLGGRSQSSNEAASTDHGRNLVEAARMLEARKADADPEITARLTTAANSGERANAGIRAAVVIATGLALDMELDDKDALATVRERLPRLAVTLREAGRQSDQAVRDLTEAILGIRGTPSATPARAPSRATPRRPESSFIPREAMSEPNPNFHRRNGSIAFETPTSRQSSYAGPLVSSPSMRMSVGRETPRGERHTPYTPRERYDSGASASSSRHESSTTSSRYEGPRSLDPIEQSPPRVSSHRTSPNTTVGREGQGTLRMAERFDRSLSRSDSRPPNPHPTPETSMMLPTVSASPELEPEHSSLRKQPSSGSTHTVRPHSFVPSHAPEPTTALSNSPAFSQPSLPMSRDLSSGSGQEERKSHKRQDSHTSTSSMFSDPTSPSVQSDHQQRLGTFGAAEGARVRASVSERFRKHLTGE